MKAKEEQQMTERGWWFWCTGRLVAEVRVRESGSPFFEFLKMKTEPGLGAKPGFEE